MKMTRWLILVSFVLIILNNSSIIYFNIFTHSLPYGIYIKAKGVPQINDYASSCLTPQIARYGIDRGYLFQGNCPTGTVMVLKMIKGLPGDHFDVRQGFLELNGHSYRIMNTDSSQRSLDVFYLPKNGVIDQGKYFLLSDFVKNSWDSRYWGPVSIQFLLKPLWIFENVKQPQISHS